jgi:hypothetical protein
MLEKVDKLMFKKAMKIFMVAMLLLSLTALISLEFSANGSSTTDFPSDLPLLYVDPENVTGKNPGDSFTVSVKIFNLTDTPVSGCKEWLWGCPLEMGGGLSYVLGDLYGLTIDFSWNPNILEYTGHTVTIPVEDYPGGVLHEPVLEVEDIVTEGAYSVSYAGMAPTTPPVFNGNGTIFNMTFTVIQKGTCFLHFNYSQLLQPDPYKYFQYIPHYVRDGYFGRDVEVSKVEVVEKIAEGYPAWVNVTASNLGGGTENFTLAAYHNTTENSGWEPLRIQPVPQPPLAQNEQNVTNMPGISFHYGECPEEGKFVASNKTVRLWWNTTGVAQGHYRIKVNTTEVPNEQNITNNVQYSESLICITIEEHDMLIETLVIVVPSTNPRTQEQFEFPPPLVTGEFANINFTVLNDGTVEETGLNVTLYYVDPDGNTEILLTHKNLTQVLGNRTVFELELWNTTDFKGYYTVGANVSTVSGEDTTNNRMEQSFWIVQPPNVNLTYTKGLVYIGDTVTFNATSSTHNMPDGNIVHWEWKVYKDAVTPENLKYTYDGGPIMNFTFDEWSDKWPVILNVTDNYGLFYMGYDRLSTIPYHYAKCIIMIEDWTAPSITNVFQTPLDNVLPEDEVKINATVVDYGSGVKQVTLNYTNDNGTWISLNMTNLEGNVWNATIPQFAYCTNVTYIIIAEDNVGNTITTAQVLGYEYQYHVIPEFPSFLILPLFIMATLLIVIIYRRKHSMQLEHARVLR